jgi:hypothetical protein
LSCTTTAIAIGRSVAALSFHGSGEDGSVVGLESGLCFPDGSGVDERREVSDCL